MFAKSVPWASWLLRTEDVPASDISLSSHIFPRAFSRHMIPIPTITGFTIRTSSLPGNEPDTALSFSTLGIINDAGRIRYRDRRRLRPGPNRVADHARLISMHAPYIDIWGGGRGGGGGGGGLTGGKGGTQRQRLYPDSDGVMRPLGDRGGRDSPEQIVGSLARLMSRGLIADYPEPAQPGRSTQAREPRRTASTTPISTPAPLCGAGGAACRSGPWKHDYVPAKRARPFAATRSTPEYMLHLFFR